MKPKPQTVYKIGGYKLGFTQDRDTGYWSWILLYRGDWMADSSDDIYTTLSHAKRAFRATQKAIAKFTV